MCVRGTTRRCRLARRRSSARWASTCSTVLSIWTSPLTRRHTRYDVIAIRLSVSRMIHGILAALCVNERCVRVYKVAGGRQGEGGGEGYLIAALRVDLRDVGCSVGPETTGNPIACTSLGPQCVSRRSACHAIGTTRAIIHITDQSANTVERNNQKDPSTTT